MNTNDSLTGGGRRELSDDVMPRESDIQDSGHAPSSATITKRDDAGYHHSPPHVIPQGSIPIQGQVLVDPATGQHYIVPQAPFFPPAMQTMYFHHPPAVYYPYGQVQPQGYVMQSTTSQTQYSVPIATYQQVPPYGFRPAYIPTTSSAEDKRDDDRRLEDPPPSSPSMSMASASTYFTGVRGCTPAASISQQYRSSSQPQNPHRCSPNSQPEDPESGRDGFRRDVTRPDSEFQRLPSEFHRQGSGEFDRPTDGFSHMRSGDGLRAAERTPLYGGPPQWWGRERDDNKDSVADVESPRPPHHTSPQNGALSDPESSRSRPVPARAVRMDIDLSKIDESEIPKPRPHTSRSIRMDIDLSKLPDATKVIEKRGPSRAPATAFTVNFDSPTEGVSLQDAARRSAQARRIFGRRSGGGSASSSANQPDRESRPTELPQSPSSNKRYLLNKLLEGEGHKDDETSIHGTDHDERKEYDASSEAGTYVVDMSSRVGSSAVCQQLMPAKIVEDSDATSDTDSDSETESDGSAVPRPHLQKTVQSPTKLSTNVQIVNNESASNTTNNRGSLVQELAKLRNLAGIPAATSPSTTRASSSVTRSSGAHESPRVGLGATQQQLRPNTGRASLGAQPSNRAALAVLRTGSGNSTQQLRKWRCQSETRGDGGRYSMRGNTPGVATPSLQQHAKKPPFRAGAAPMRTVGFNPAQQKVQEMNAWLRRKDYNPMKAAAEARKAKELKAREEQFVSNRSLSFHVGPVMLKPSRGDGFKEITRNRSQESLAVEDAEHASQRVIAEYSRGVVQDISRLSQQSSRATGKQLSGLARTVDLLSQKCKKSIELIRSQNKGCLSVSVEDLLATAAEPARKGETLNEQLDRLSDAFDAVQRYLEQYSLDGHESPIPDFTDDVSEIHSSASSFSLRKANAQQDESPNQTRPALRSLGTSSSFSTMHS
ncbi:hypothetical protein KIN20_002369 [Parelaphostrongylus tenuis]|uniref:Uncharacterized protein n=1 Tax=Parelaphostrongylus tenuis TaxID=148309 RepID=A0AAD5LYD6_PARTN|nr:hypothetical protein KIN20_002369 [Parelaphostrongylus tenuis]